jgi:hypothetical protein
MPSTTSPIWLNILTGDDVVATQDYLPATGAQLLLIARLCMALRIRELMEERVMSRGEAGRLIRQLIQQKKGW